MVALIAVVVIGVVTIAGARVYQKMYGINAHALGPIAAPARLPKSAPLPKQLTWAFCGVSPDDPSAQTAANNMHSVAGIDATMGPCLPYDNYNPADTGTRYDTPQNYMRLLYINAKAGMKTIIYDQRLWDDNPFVRAVAYSYWKPVYASIAAWDMGDEFDPATDQWKTLVSRWKIMIDNTLPQTGIKPFTNHTWIHDGIGKGLIDLPYNNWMLSFDQYDYDQGVTLATKYNNEPNTTLMCAVNALQQLGLPTVAPTYIVNTMIRLRTAGCDAFLIFGGHIPYEKPGVTGPFGTSSLVNPNGSATSWATAVKQGSQP